MSASEKLVGLIQSADFSGQNVTLIGYGSMGKEYIKGLRSIGIRNIRVCSRSKEPLSKLEGVENISLYSGGYHQFRVRPALNELAILATPTADLIPCAIYLRELGYKKFLIEKPISLWSSDLQQLQKAFNEEDVVIYSAYNRVAYPVILDAKERAQAEGGITSASYSFTEFTNRIDPAHYTPEEAGRWGIANSIHVISMAHALIGLPKEWKSYRAGDGVVWHSAGSVFVGGGKSEEGIGFSYQADWGSTGRWWVEINTRKSSYRFCPLETLSFRKSFKEDWQSIPVAVYDAGVKAGFVEQIAAILHPQIRKIIPLMDLNKAIKLTRFGENIFGYSAFRKPN